jgi:hypothetical protein
MRTLDVMKCIALGTVSCLAVAGCVLTLQVSNAVLRTQVSIAVVTTHVDQLLDQIGDTNKEVGELVNDSRATVTEVNRTALAERHYFQNELPQTLAGANAILRNLGEATADAPGLITSATATINSLQPIEHSAEELLNTVQAQSAGSLPALADTATHLDEASQNLVTLSHLGIDSMTSVRAIAADGQQEVHSILHPKPITRIADWTLKIVHAFAGWF